MIATISVVIVQNRCSDNWKTKLKEDANFCFYGSMSNVGVTNKDEEDGL